MVGIGSRVGRQGSTGSEKEARQAGRKVRERQEGQVVAGEEPSSRTHQSGEAGTRAGKAGRQVGGSRQKGKGVTVVECKEGRIERRAGPGSVCM